MSSANPSPESGLIIRDKSNDQTYLKKQRKEGRNKYAFSKKKKKKKRLFATTSEFGENERKGEEFDGKTEQHARVRQTGRELYQSCGGGPSKIGR